MLGVGEAVAITVGIVVGAGIFRTPSLVAANVGSEAGVLLAWTLGGLISLAGALTYAELATAFPSAGGDYYFLRRAYGSRLAFLFAWARLSVIQTGSVALLAFVFGDYATRLLNLGNYSSAVYAGLLVVFLTALNVTGVKQGTVTQSLLTGVEVAGVALVIIAGLLFVAPPVAVTVAAGTADAAGASTSFGLAMVFVLLTYGGWNEAVYVAAELRDSRRNMVRVLVFSILLLTALYVLVNWAYLRALGLDGARASDAVAGDVMSRAFGATGATLISALVAVSALTSANATIFTGARSAYALGRDFPALSFMGRWSGRGQTPVTALLVQGATALLLVLMGALTRENFQTVVEYTAPVFWLFFLLTGVALFVLRRREPEVARPYQVPLYPLVPLVFCLSAAYLLYSSLAYTGAGALVGVAVLAAGALLLLAFRPREDGGNDRAASSEGEM